VVDYLTRFSGLTHDDLEPATSRHHLVTPRAAYLKLRYLVDRGCILVGHGLRKDFRTINIFVPGCQVRRLNQELATVQGRGGFSWCAVCGWGR
jgi:PAB-dependent poly(A)-specific ribonuclease subunit 2